MSRTAGGIMNSSVGILGTGLFLPDEVRRHDWWPDAVVARWMNRRRTMRAPVSEAKELSEGASLVRRAMGEQSGDPFKGVVERRVMSADMNVLEMEDRAARIAIERAGIDPQRNNRTSSASAT
jgi:3-oxoacyl-[acyl-carrier-protein] synthase-3